MKLILILTNLMLGMVLQAGWKENTVAAVLVAEAGIDGRVGMECVAEVLRNRAQAKGVRVISLINSNVFSSLIGRTPTQIFHKELKADAKRLQTAIEIAEVLLRKPDQLPGRVHGATHFCRVENHPWWAARMKTVAVVKRHKFYRE